MPPSPIRRRQPHKIAAVLGLAVAMAGAPLAAPIAAPVAAPVAAQQQGITVYEPEAFANAAPANALDLVLRLPGFAIIEADPDVRGYAGAQGNVLIDGARPASKREDIRDLLRRIPVGLVERIELIRAAPGVDMAGHAVLANVVRDRAASAEMAAEGGLAVHGDGTPGAHARFEYGRQNGERTLELAVSAERAQDSDTGRGSIRTATPGGAPVEDAVTDVDAMEDSFEVSAGWRGPLAAGWLALTGAARSERERVDEQIDTMAPSPGLEIARERETYRELETAARYVRPLGERSTLEILLSRTQGRIDALSETEEDGDHERFAERIDTSETILRLDLTRETSARLSLNAGLEAALNTLDGQADLTENGAPVAIPGSTARIEERRAEAALGMTWRPAPAWVLEGGLRVEASAIRQQGDASLERDFVYFKPALSARFEPDDNNRFRLSVSREAGQLDFSDFVASASLTTGVIRAGNAELEPDKTWRYAASWERRFWEDGALTITLTHEAISDVVDRVPVVLDGETFDAPGNIGAGVRDTLAVELSTSLDRLGATGFRLSSSALWRTSAVTDPATGETRRISGEPYVEGALDLTRSLPARRMTWGVGLRLAERESEHRFDEISESREALRWEAFIERRIGDGWRLRAEAADLFGRRSEEMRLKFDGPRATHPLEEVEHRRHRAPGRILITLRRSMGG